MAYKDGMKDRQVVSSHNFLNIVYPKLRVLGWLSGELISAESENARRALRELDMKHGIDYIHITNGGGYEGISSRIQSTNISYNTFSISVSRPNVIRYNTEFEKTKRNIATGGKYPIWVVHAYLTKPVDGELLAVGMAKTTDVYDAIDVGMCAQRNNPSDGCEFVSVLWDDVPCKTWIRDPEYDAEWLAYIEKEGDAR